MKVTGALLWVTGAHVNLRESQIKKLDDLVLVAIEIGRGSLSELGRMLAEKRSGAAKDAIKPDWRFTSSVAVHVSNPMQGPLRWLFGGRKRVQRSPCCAPRHARAPALAACLSEPLEE